MSDERKRLIQRWTQLVWNERRTDVIYEMMAEDCLVGVEGMSERLDRDGFRDYLLTFLSAVPDVHVEQTSIITEGDTSFLTSRVTGTHLGYGLGIPPSGRRVDFTGVTRIEFRGDLIVGGFDRWNRGEVLASLMQVRMDDLRRHSGLTKREAQVALLMAERMSHTEIATDLFISPNTARRYCERILQKLGVHRRQDVAEAIGKIPGSVLSHHGEDLKRSPTAAPQARVGR